MRKVGAERGFTIIEVCVVVAIIGIIATVAIPLFLGQIKKTKLTEVSLAIDKARKDLSVYYANRSDMPPSSTGFMPPADACSTGTGKTPPTAEPVWSTDPAFGALGFNIPEAGYFQYTWIRTSQTIGMLVMRMDLDCDGVFGSVIATFTVVSGTTIAVNTAYFLDE
jgi:prepilin-type N-terminal cleavage/methylation domain-containing protein